jgi:hypothetical protein
VPEESQKLLKLKRLATWSNGNKKFVQNRFPISVSSLSLSAFQEFLFIVFLPLVSKVNPESRPVRRNGDEVIIVECYRKFNILGL